MLMENGTYTDAEIEKFAGLAAADPKKLAKMPNLVEVGVASALYPNSFDALVWDIEHYKDVIPFENVKVPALICHGDKDADIGVHCAEAANAIPGSELNVIKDGCHILMLHPDYDELVFRKQVNFVKANLKM